MKIEPHTLETWRAIAANFLEQHWHWLLAGVMCLMALVFLRRLWLGQASWHWPTAPGTILDSEVRHSRDSEGDSMWSAHVRYAYRVAGREYTGTRVRFGDEGTSCSWKSSSEYVVECYPPGRNVRVLHHPRRPKCATLEPGASFWGALWFLLAATAAGFFIRLAWIEDGLTPLLAGWLGL